MLGDSLIDGLEWNAAFPKARIVNQAISGDTTVGLLSRINAAIDTRASVAIVMIGLNDISLLNVEPAEIRPRYEAIIDRLSAAGMKVIVNSVLIGLIERTESVQELNEYLRNKCKTGACVYVDLEAKLSRNGLLLPEYTYDGHHFTAPAYKIWVDQLAPYIPAAD